MGDQLLTTLAPLLLLATCGAWVLVDARSREAGGRPVVATVGPVSIERPEVWATLSVLVCVLAVPLYLVARGADD